MKLETVETVEYALTQEVKQIGEIHFEGNIIPHTWLQNLRLPSGYVDLPAIMLLAEIVYWYRPVIERDPEHGRIVSIRKKFQGDALRVSYENLASRLGLTKRQVIDAIRRLEYKGLIVREVRLVELPNGVKQNAVFIKPIPDAIKSLTFNYEELRYGEEEKG